MDFHAIAADLTFMGKHLFFLSKLVLLFFFLCLSIWLSVFIELMIIWPDANLAVGEKLIPPNWINPTILPSSFLSPSDQMLQSR
jgi:hypothetical protein